MITNKKCCTYETLIRRDAFWIVDLVLCVFFREKSAYNLLNVSNQLSHSFILIVGKKYFLSNLTKNISFISFMLPKRLFTCTWKIMFLRFIFKRRTVFFVLCQSTNPIILYSQNRTVFSSSRGSQKSRIFQSGRVFDSYLIHENLLLYYCKNKVFMIILKL